MFSFYFAKDGWPSSMPDIHSCDFLVVERDYGKTQCTSSQHTETINSTVQDAQVLATAFIQSSYVNFGPFTQILIENNSLVFTPRFISMTAPQIRRIHTPSPCVLVQLIVVAKVINYWNPLSERRTVKQRRSMRLCGVKGEADGIAVEFLKREGTTVIKWLVR